jgi:hypothetical protein
MCAAVIIIIAVSVNLGTELAIFNLIITSNLAQVIVVIVAIPVTQALDKIPAAG